jgi:hypothetical protein
MAEKRKYTFKDQDVDYEEQKTFNKEIDTFIDGIIEKGNDSAS